jgi:hypothetical protein
VVQGLGALETVHVAIIDFGAAAVKDRIIAGRSGAAAGHPVLDNDLL